MILSTLVAVLNVVQTEWFVRRYPPPGGMEKVKADMTADRDLQNQHREEYAESGKELVQGIAFNSLFTEDQKKALKDVTDSLLNDEHLQDDLKQEFGVSFKDLNAMVIPAWQIHNEGNKFQLGLTDVCWKAAREPAGKLHVGGFTVRDTVKFKGRLTLDGTPRIALNYQAFNSIRDLRLALFHEMLHALNVPGFYPCPIILTQTDLTYLPEYRSFIKQERLNNSSQEYSLWCFLIIMPLIISFIKLLEARRYSPLRMATT
jgi:hypothetical protein